jgi:hypothetical protein
LVGQREVDREPLVGQLDRTSGGATGRRHGLEDHGRQDGGTGFARSHDRFGEGGGLAHPARPLEHRSTRQVHQLAQFGSCTVWATRASSSTEPAASSWAKNRLLARSR